MTDWKPIESAPKDGRRVLASGVAWTGERVYYVVRWVRSAEDNGGEPWHEWQDDCGDAVEILDHWAEFMPLD